MKTSKVFCFLLCVIVIISVKGKEDDKDGEGTKTKNPYFTRFQQTAHLRPTKCQVCRLLVTELLDRLRITNHKETLNKGYGTDLGEEPRLQIHYHKSFGVSQNGSVPPTFCFGNVHSELRLMEVLDNLCDRVKLYRARAGPEFPYIKGAKSHLREVLDDLSSKSKVNLNYQMPEEVIDDYTYEVGRIKFKCIHMLEEYEEAIEEWYSEHQEQELMTWLCAQKILKNQDKDCLTASTDMPSDYYDAFKKDNTTERKKPEIPMRDASEDL